MELGRLEKEACHSLQYFFLGETIRHFCESTFTSMYKEETTLKKEPEHN